MFANIEDSRDFFHSECLAERKLILFSKTGYMPFLITRLINYELYPIDHDYIVDYKI